MNNGNIRPCREEELKTILEIVNDAAQAYQGVIPDDCFHTPYMDEKELRQGIADGIRFWGYESDGGLIGVMGIQPVQDVSLIRHAYVRTQSRNQGIGGKLMSFLLEKTQGPILVGTWKTAVWAIGFYEKHGFKLVTPEEKDLLLPKYWGCPKRQIETSVVLADPKYLSGR